MVKDAKQKPAFALWPDEIIFRLEENVITKVLGIDKSALSETIDHLESKAVDILEASESFENVPERIEGEDREAFHKRQRDFWALEVLWVIAQEPELSPLYCAARVFQSCTQIRRAIAKGDGERAAAWSMLLIACALQEQFAVLLKDIRKISEVAADDNL